MPTLITVTQQCAGNPSRTVRQEKTGNEEAKVSIFADAMILYIESPKDYTKKNC